MLSDATCLCANYFQASLCQYDQYHPPAFHLLSKTFSINICLYFLMSAQFKCTVAHRIDLYLITINLRICTCVYVVTIFFTLLILSSKRFSVIYINLYFNRNTKAYTLAHTIILLRCKQIFVQILCFL